MRSRLGSTLTTLAVLLAAGSAAAHHSFATVFDASKPVTLIGTLTKVEWKNPHIAFSLDAKGEHGQPESWVIEAGPPNFFLRHNIVRTDFAIGRRVTVEAVRARNGSLFGSLLKLSFANGKSVTSSLGS